MASDFVVKGELGRGAFGVVYLIEKKDTKEKLALKAVEFRRSGRSDKDSAKQEASLLSRLDNPFVVSYVTSYVCGETLFIITEFCEGGDLGSYLERSASSDPLPEDLIVCWTAQITMALAYLHQNGVLHRDLKPPNIYLSGDCNIRVGDLGIAKVLERPDAMASTMAGTPVYMSPEMFQHRPYDSRSDIWSLGCVVYEMAAAKRAFGDGPPILLFLMMRVVSGNVPPIPDWYSTDLRGLVMKMMDKEPRTRPDATSLLETSPVKEYIATGKPPMEIIKSTRTRTVQDGQRQPKRPRHMPFQDGDIKVPPESLQVHRKRMQQLDKDVTSRGMSELSRSPAGGGAARVPNKATANGDEAFVGPGTMLGYQGLLNKSQKSKNKAARKEMPDLAKQRAPPQVSTHTLTSLNHMLSSMRATEDAEEGGEDTLVESPEGAAAPAQDKKEKEQQYLLRQIQVLQGQCARGLGEETLAAAYRVMDRVSDHGELKNELVGLLGKEKFDGFGHKIMYLRLFELGLDKLSR